jgi:hypothetical protein
LRLVKGLQLDEELVDDAGDAFPPATHAHARPGGADGVDLLYKSDRPALLAGRLAQLGEERSDLSVRLPVEH